MEIEYNTVMEIPATTTACFHVIVYSITLERQYIVP